MEVAFIIGGCIILGAIAGVIVFVTYSHTSNASKIKSVQDDTTDIKDVLKEQAKSVTELIVVNSDLIKSVEKLSEMYQKSEERISKFNAKLEKNSDFVARVYDRQQKEYTDYKHATDKRFLLLEASFEKQNNFFSIIITQIAKNQDYASFQQDNRQPEALSEIMKLNPNNEKK